MRGALLVASTAVCWALTILLDKLAVARAAPAFHALVLNAGVGLACLALLALRRGIRQLSSLRRLRGTLIVALLVSAAALGFQLVALPLIAVGTLETVKRGIGNLVALANGWLLLGEALTPVKLFAVTLMSVGVALVLR